MQANPAELYLGSNCLLKMSFQGHEEKSSSKTIVKPTADRQIGTVANMPHLPHRTDYVLPHHNWN